MHELSLVMGIIDIAEEQVKKNHGSRVDQIELEIGTMAGVVMESLDFAWDVAVKNTVLRTAARQVIRVQAKARCMNCNNEFFIESRFEPCPICHDYLTAFVQGKELRVKSLVIS